MLIKKDEISKNVNIAKYNYPILKDRGKDFGAGNIDKFLDSTNINLDLDSSQERLEKEMFKTQESGFTEGYAQGEKMGYDKGAKSVQPHIQSLADTINAIRDQQEKVIAQSEQFVVEFVFKIVERILGSEELQKMKIDKSKLQSIVKEAINQFSDSIKYNIRVHKETANMIEKYKTEILEKLPSHLEFAITEDPSLKPGDCLIESDHGVLDARIETQLNQIKDLFTKQQSDGNPDAL